MNLRNRYFYFRRTEAFPNKVLQSNTIFWLNTDIFKSLASVVRINSTINPDANNPSAIIKNKENSDRKNNENIKKQRAAGSLQLFVNLGLELLVFSFISLFMLESVENEEI